MSNEEQMAIELLAFYKASTFMMWEGQSIELINETARQQALFAIRFAVDRIIDQCQELADENDLELTDVLYKHAGFRYYEKIEYYVNKIPLEDYD